MSFVVLYWIQWRNSLYQGEPAHSSPAGGDNNVLVQAALSSHYTSHRKRLPKAYLSVRLKPRADQLQAAQALFARIAQQRENGHTTFISS